MYLVETAFIGGCLWLAKHAPSVARPRNSGRNDCPIAETPSEAISERASKSLFVPLVGRHDDNNGGRFAAPTLAIPAVVKVLVMLSVYLAFLEMLRRYGAFRPGLSPLSKLAVAGGIISFWILISPLKSLAVRQPRAGFLWRADGGFSREGVATNGEGRTDSQGAVNGVQLNLKPWRSPRRLRPGEFRTLAYPGNARPTGRPRMQGAHPRRSISSRRYRASASPPGERPHFLAFGKTRQFVLFAFGMI